MSSSNPEKSRRLSQAVFVAYAGVDRRRVEPHVEILKELGVHCVWDQTFPKGPDFVVQIASAIDTCRGVVAFLSRKSMKTEWFLSELAVARQRGKPTLFIDLEELANEDIPSGALLYTAGKNRLWTGDRNFDIKLRKWLADCVTQSVELDVVGSRNARSRVRELEQATRSRQLVRASKLLAVLTKMRMPSKAQPRVLDCAAKLRELQGDGAESRSYLWELREHHIRTGQARKSIDAIQRRVIDTIINTDSRPWADSAAKYREFLRRFPHALQMQLTEHVAAQIHLLSLTTGLRTLIDVCCGTGVLAERLTTLRAPVSVVGFDIPEMIDAVVNSARGRDWPFRSQWAGHEFRPIHDLWSQRRLVKAARVDAAVMNMVIFQFGVRERLLLLKQLNTWLRDDALLWITTDGPDFLFPDAEMNIPNQFKIELHRIWNLRGLDPGKDGSEALRPHFAKDTLDSIRWTLEVCGFSLTTGAQILPVLRVERDVAERIAFTRLPAISRKLYGRVIDDRWWDIAEKDFAKQDYRDHVLGTVLLAKKVRPGVPHIFFEAPAPRQTQQAVRFAMAAVLRRSDGRTLIVKRNSLGKHVQDFPLTWSLPSSHPREGESMEQRLRLSLKENLGIEAPPLVPCAVRISTRDNELFIMHLYAGKLPSKFSPPRTKTRKYIQCDWWTDQDIVSGRWLEGGRGDCIIALQDLLRMKRLK